MLAVCCGCVCVSTKLFGVAESCPPGGYSAASAHCAQVVNICCEEHPGAGYGRQPEPAREHVKMVHVMFRRSTSTARVSWSGQVMEELPVIGGHGGLHFYEMPEMDASFCPNGIF